MDYILHNAAPIAAATVAGLTVSILYHILVGGSLHRGLPPSRRGVLLPAVLLQAWLACILAGAVILAPKDQGAGPWVMALGSALIIWAGFVGPVLLISYRYRGLGWVKAIADASVWLAIMLTQAAVLQAIGVEV